MVPRISKLEALARPLGGAGDVNAYSNAGSGGKKAIERLSRLGRDRVQDDIFC
jgi:hypothetical protein